LKDVIYATATGANKFAFQDRRYAMRQPRLRFKWRSNSTHYGLRHTLTSDYRSAPKSHARRR